MNEVIAPRHVTQPAALSLEEERSVEKFLYHEARLLDERRWDEWLALFTPDGMYWAPLTHEQEDARTHVSLFWENALLREVRVRRLRNWRNWSQQPPSYSAHVIGNVVVDAIDAENGDLIVHSTFHMTEWRQTNQRLFAGSFQYRLVRGDGSYAIRLKRVNLINCDAVHENLQIFI